MSFQDLFIKPASTDDFEFYYSLKCELESVYWSGFKSVPDKARLHTWFIQKVKCFENKDSYKLYTIFNLNDGEISRVGYLSIYLSDCYENCCEVGIGISTAFMGKGIGTRAIKIATDECKRLGYQKVYAYIRKDNVRSHSAFIKAGFVAKNKIKAAFIDNLDNDVKMCEYKYIFVT